MVLLQPPSAVPNWALQNQVDPVSGQNNVLVPPTQQQQFGWGRLPFPPRQWFNWLGRLTANWIEYFKQNDSKSQTVITTAIGNGSTTVLPICNNANNPRGITMIYINDVQTGENDTWAVYMYIRNAGFDLVPNLISNSGVAGKVITVGAVIGATGLLTNISTTAGGSPQFNVVAVSYSTIL
jgi:hypothetical protein